MRRNIHKNQAGLASLVIAIMIVVIVSTLVLGFTQIIRREQRRSLDNQLSSQAYYAAESGVNDAKDAIINQKYAADKTTCAPLSDPLYPAISGNNSNLLSGDGNVQYSCLLIDQSPNTLEYDKISTTDATVFPITATSGLPIQTLTFSWQNPDGVTSKLRHPSDNTFVPESDWDSFGLLRLDLVPASSLTRANLVNATKAFFMYPNAGGPPAMVDYSGTTSGEIIKAKCSGGQAAKTTHVCDVTYGNIPAGPLYARVQAMYGAVKVTVKATDTNGDPVSFSSAQKLIDVTGKAADVTRRIQVRIPAKNFDIPTAAIGSMDSFCKKFSITPVGVTSDEPAEPACVPN